MLSPLFVHNLGVSSSQPWVPLALHEGQALACLSESALTLHTQQQNIRADLLSTPTSLAAGWQPGQLALANSLEVLVISPSDNHEVLHRDY
jgi:hypothetical protein